MVRYKNKGKTIVYSAGATRQDVIRQLENRISKRQKELEKRQWIYDEYKSLLAKQAEDRDWLNWCKNITDEKWNEK